jgi:hypothetical protein
MLRAEKIQQHIQKLPEELQVEVLDFVEYLLLKSERESLKRGDIDWSSLSLAFAMRDMEDEDTPAYTTDDLKVVYS